MTVLIREELNEADLAWAAADPAVAAAMGQVLQARRSLARECESVAHLSVDVGSIDPAVLRARGAL